MIITLLRYSLLFFVFFTTHHQPAPKKYFIGSAEELKKLRLQPGDTVVLKAGTWTDQKLELKASGTEKSPVVMKAAVPGGVKLTGSSILHIEGKWLVVSGLYFIDGDPGNEPVINFHDSATWCRLTNTAVVNCNPVDKTVTTQFVSMHGAHHRVDHCYFENKTNHGPTLVVWLSAKPNYHQIDHNHFGPRKPLGVNGGETIRIGTSTWSLYDSYTTVEHNLFEHCDGELEIVSNKSCHNTLRYNTFFESQGTLTLRHGNDALVYGNFFIGNNIKNTGGIRIIGERHVVYNNHFHDLKGSGASAAISIMDGMPNSPLTGYYQVKRAQVFSNTMINCEEAFSLGTGKREDRYLVPVDCEIRDNRVLMGNKVVVWGDSLQNLRMENNLLYSDSKAQLPIGFKNANPKSFPDSLQQSYQHELGKLPLKGKAGTTWVRN
jgi:poly(beta-D-mannuronate) lyase